MSFLVETRSEAYLRTQNRPLVSSCARRMVCSQGEIPDQCIQVRPAGNRENPARLLDSQSCFP